MSMVVVSTLRFRQDDHMASGRFSFTVDVSQVVRDSLTSVVDEATNPSFRKNNGFVASSTTHSVHCLSVLDHYAARLIQQFSQA